MAQVEGFPDITIANVATTDYLYVRSSAQPSGSRDKRMGINAAFKALLNAAALIQTILGRSDAPTLRGDLGFLTATAALDFPSIAAGAKADLTITVAGAAVGDAVILGLPAAPAAGLVFNAFVSAADTVTIRASNTSSGAVDAASATYRAVVIKSA